VALDLGYTYCTTVTYEAPGFAWAVTAYASGGSVAFDCGAAGYEWVTIKAIEFWPLYQKALIGDGSPSSGGGSPSTVGQFTAEEVAALKYQAANPSPFTLSVSEGGIIAAAVVTLWALAWGIRSTVKTLSDSSQE
jgi:hypothetical protein